MREIKFRAWDKDNKRWITDNISGNLALGAETSSLILEIADYRIHSNIEWHQFTGLKDKTGKEIYEGDICVSLLDETGVVKFINSGFWLEYLPPYDWDFMCPGQPVTNDIEVIGNIYEKAK